MKQIKPTKTAISIAIAAFFFISCGITRPTVQVKETMLTLYKIRSVGRSTGQINELTWKDENGVVFISYCRCELAIGTQMKYLITR